MLFQSSCIFAVILGFIVSLFSLKHCPRTLFIEMIKDLRHLGIRGIKSKIVFGIIACLISILIFIVAIHI